MRNVIQVRVQGRYARTFQAGYGAGLDGWGRHYCPFRQGPFKDAWVAGWELGRAGLEVKVLEVNDQVNDLAALARRVRDARQSDALCPRCGNTGVHGEGREYYCSVCGCPRGPRWTG